MEVKWEIDALRRDSNVAVGKQGESIGQADYVNTAHVRVEKSKIDEGNAKIKIGHDSLIALHQRRVSIDR